METTYQYRLKYQVGNDIVYGDILSFETVKVPSVSGDTPLTISCVEDIDKDINIVIIDCIDETSFEWVYLNINPNIDISLQSQTYDGLNDEMSCNFRLSFTENYNLNTIITLKFSDNSGSSQTDFNVEISPINDPPETLTTPSISNEQAIRIGGKVSSVKGDWTDPDN